MLVEDDALIAVSLKSLLEDEGCVVRVGVNVRAALSMLEEGWEVIVLDLMLPDGDGEQIMHRAHERGLGSRFIVVTGVNDPERLDALQRLHPHAVMHKPVLFEELVSVIGLDRD